MRDGEESLPTAAWRARVDFLVYMLGWLVVLVGRNSVL